MKRCCFLVFLVAFFAKGEGVKNLGDALELLWDMDRVAVLDNSRLALHPPKLRSDGSLLLASGEVQPGIRTPQCVIGRFVQSRRFSALNWMVMGLYFLGLAFMGWWFMRKEKSAADYFKGGGRIPWWAAGISIFAAMFSSITFLAVPALAYMSDWSYAPKCLCFIFIPPLVICFYLPFFRKLKLISAYEYLELRFNLACRLFASLAFNLFMVARVAVVAYLPALAVANIEIRAVYDQFLKFIGILTSGLACLFMLGIFVPRVGAAAALCGLLANYVVCVGLDRMKLAWKPHLLLYGAIGILTCLVVALAVSLFLPNRKRGIEGLMWVSARD